MFKSIQESLLSNSDNLPKLISHLELKNIQKSLGYNEILTIFSSLVKYLVENPSGKTNKSLVKVLQQFFQCIFKNFEGKFDSILKKYQKDILTFINILAKLNELDEFTASLNFLFNLIKDPKSENSIVKFIQKLINTFEMKPFTICPVTDEKALLASKLTHMKLQTLIEIHPIISLQRFFLEATQILFSFLSTNHCLAVYPSLVANFRIVERESLTAQRNFKKFSSFFWTVSKTYIELCQSLNVGSLCTCIEAKDAKMLWKQLVESFTVLNTLKTENSSNDTWKTLQYLCMKVFRDVCNKLSKQELLNKISFELFVRTSPKMLLISTSEVQPEASISTVNTAICLFTKISLVNTLPNNMKEKYLENSIKLFSSFQRFYGNCPDKFIRYLLDVQNVMCDYYRHKMLDKDHLQPFIDICSSVLNQYLKLEEFCHKKVTQCCKTLNRLQQAQGDYQQAMVQSVLVLKHFQTSNCEADLIRQVVLFANNKLMFIEKEVANSRPCPSKVSSADLLDDLFVKENQQFVVQILSYELKYYNSWSSHHLPATRNLINKVLQLAPSSTAVYAQAVVRLQELSHTWPDSFSTINLNVFEALKTADDEIRGTHLSWQLESSALLYEYLFEWESKILKNEKFLAENKSEMSPAKQVILTSLPESSSDMKKIIQMKFCDSKESLERTGFTLDSFNNARTLAYLLRLRGEWLCSIQLLSHLEKILTENQGALFCRLLLSVKTDLSELFMKINESNLALKKCEEAFQVISDFCKSEKLSEQDICKSDFVLGKYNVVKLIICHATTLLALSRFDEAKSIYEKLVDDEYLQKNSPPDVRKYFISFLYMKLSAKLFNTYLKLNRDIPDYFQEPSLVYMYSLRLLLPLVKKTLPRVFKYSYQFPAASTSDHFKFGQKEQQEDIIFQFQIIDFYLLDMIERIKILHNRGDIRSSLPYLLDGINTTRILLLPEREIEFQLLMVEREYIQRNKNAVYEELLVTSDIIKFVDQLHQTLPASRRLMASTNTLKTFNEASNEKTIEKTTDVVKDEDRIIKQLPLQDHPVVDVIDRQLPSRPASPVLRSKKKRIKTFKLEEDVDKTFNFNKISNWCLQASNLKYLEVWSAYLAMIGDYDRCSKSLSISHLAIDNIKHQIQTDLNKIHNFIYNKDGDFSRDHFLYQLEASHLLACSENLFALRIYDKSQSAINLMLQLLNSSGVHHQDHLLLYGKALFLSSQLRTKMSSSRSSSNSFATDKPNNINTKMLNWIINCSSNCLDVKNKPPQKKAASLKDKNPMELTPRKTSDFLQFKTPAAAKFPPKSTKKTPAKWNQYSVSTKKIPRTTLAKKSASKSFKKFQIYEDDPLYKEDDLETEETSIRMTRSVARRLRTKDLPIPSIKQKRKEEKANYREANRLCFTDEDVDEERVKRPQIYNDDEEVEVIRRCPPERRSVEEDYESSFRADHFLKDLYFDDEDVDPHHLEDSSIKDHLQRAFEIATISGDFHTSKRSLRLKMMLLDLQESSNIQRAVALHMQSFGFICRFEMLHLSNTLNRKLEKQSSDAAETSQQLRYYKSLAESLQPKSVIRDNRQLDSYLSNIKEIIEDDWTVVMMSRSCVSDDDRAFDWPITISRIRGNQSSRDVNIHFTSTGMTKLLEDFEDAMNELSACSKVTEKVEWWTTRLRVDKKLQGLVDSLDESLFGFLRSIFTASFADANDRREVEESVKRIRDVLTESPVTSGKISEYKMSLIEVILEGWSLYTAEDKVLATCWLLGNDEVTEEVTCLVCSTFTIESEAIFSKPKKRGHVILVLDKYLNSLPWESMKIMKSQSASRILSIDLLKHLLSMKQLRVNYEQVDFSNVSYVVNPIGDLKKTEDRFHAWFRSATSWQGLFSKTPSGEEWIKYLEKSDVLIYCGHGSGSQFVSREEVMKCSSRACPLLMGCSSGKLREDGITEPFATAIAYLLAGSPCVLTCLWTVTDKDIDRYLARCLISWMSKGTCLTEVTTSSQSACKLPMTNGAACVVYGIPVKTKLFCENWKKEIPESLSSYK